jgi:hypothetical protein
VLDRSFSSLGQLLQRVSHLDRVIRPHSLGPAPAARHPRAIHETRGWSRCRSSRPSALASFISLFRAFLSFLSIHFLLFSALSSRSFYQRSSRTTRARTVQIPGMHIGPCLGQIHSSPRLFFTFVGGSGRGVFNCIRPMGCPRLPLRRWHETGRVLG